MIKKKKSPYLFLFKKKNCEKELRAFLKITDLNGCLDSGQTSISERVLLIPTLASLRSTLLTLTISFLVLFISFGRDKPQREPKRRRFWLRLKDSVNCSQRRRFQPCVFGARLEDRADSGRRQSGMSFDGGNRIEYKNQSKPSYI